MASNLATPENIKSLAHFIGSKMFTPHWLELPDGGNKKNQLTRAASCLLEGGFKELGFSVEEINPAPAVAEEKASNGRKKRKTAAKGSKKSSKKKK